METQRAESTSPHIMNDSKSPMKDAIGFMLSLPYLRSTHANGMCRQRSSGARAPEA